MNKTNLEVNLNVSDKILIFLSYIIFLPSLYIILTEKRKNHEMAFHASQSFLLWIAIFLLVIILRKAVFAILSVISIPYFYLLNEVFFFAAWAYCFYCAFLYILNKKVDIPMISKISDRLA